MSWKLWIKGNKYMLWSSCSNKFLTEKLTRNELLRVLDTHYISEGKLKLIKEYYAFPFQWSIKGTRSMSGKIKEGYMKYYDWYQSIAGSENYYEKVDKKYEEVLEAINVKE